MDCAVITTYNEAKSIGSIIHQLHSLGLEVIVVDDWSSDGTANIAKELCAHVELQTYSGGIRNGLLQAWKKALELGAHRILQLDAGNSHQVEDATRLLAALGTSDLVIGSRFMEGGTYIDGTWYRPYLSRLATWACNISFGERLTDWTSGYRAFHGSTLEYLIKQDYRAKMHGWQIEVLCYALLKDLKITEVPITYISGRSSFNRKIAWEAIKIWIRTFHRN